tara:strand:+ start:527 stop:724 length:198 start_codon:yes stop_codon:yes gene_type:complete
MPVVKFPYDDSGRKAASRAVALHPAAKLIEDTGHKDMNYKNKKPAGPGRVRPKRMDEVPSGNRYA